MMRELMRQLLDDCGIDVVGEAATASEALAAAAELRPDLILLDVHLPDGTGIDVSRTISDWSTRPRIVLVSTVDYSAVARSCGADAFVPKGELSRETLLAAVGR